MLQSWGKESREVSGAVQKSPSVSMLYLVSEDYPLDVPFVDIAASWQSPVQRCAQGAIS